MKFIINGIVYLLLVDGIYDLVVIVYVGFNLVIIVYIVIVFIDLYVLLMF